MRAPFALAFAAAFAAPLCACGGSITDAADAAGDAAPSDADAAIGCSTCLATRIDWEWNGGFALYYDRSAALPCNAYQRQRFANPYDATPTLSCTSTIRHCGGEVFDASDAISIEEVVSAAAVADVQAAFAKAPVLYGVDPRAYDGAVFRITIGGKTIEVGDACGGTAGCLEAPAGVKALAALLQDLDTRKTAADACPQLR
jgi:hypothetical protein